MDGLIQSPFNGLPLTGMPVPAAKPVRRSANWTLKYGNIQTVQSVFGVATVVRHALIRQSKKEDDPLLGNLPFLIFIFLRKYVTDLAVFFIAEDNIFSFIILLTLNSVSGGKHIRSGNKRLP